MDVPDLIAGLMQPTAYPHETAGPIERFETHISLVFLAGDCAYKVKKPVVTDFLDYGTLEKRHHACQEELRLGKRYSEGLYLDVVPITCEAGRLQIGGDSRAVEYAVKMQRFPGDALLSHQLKHGQVAQQDMRQLAISVANFHRTATVLAAFDEASLNEALHQAKLNFKHLPLPNDEARRAELIALETWTESVFESLRDAQRQRFEQGFIRECHGDLHSDNVVKWHGHWVPFDGIEFNKALTWIDVLDDASFLMVDLYARDRDDLARVFISDYLEQTGDYFCLMFLRWYAVYRALVRAKVAAIRLLQLPQDSSEAATQRATIDAKIALACRLSHREKPTLCITHGLSGSGKTTGSQQWVVSTGAIRVRADVERKRLFGNAINERFSGSIDEGIYSAEATAKTYDHLFGVAQSILRAGYSVIVDAAFLRQRDRTRFHQLANDEAVDFRILDFDADEQTLRRRILSRQLEGTDASDADLSVLTRQLATQEPLSAEEQTWVMKA